MNDDLEKTRKAYFESINSVDSENEIFDLLPLPSQSNFSVLIKGILELLKNELKEYERFKLESSDDEIVNVIKQLKLKIKIICDYYEKSTKEYFESQNIMQNTNSNQSSSRHLIFGKNLSGNIPFIDDIKKKIPKEFYFEIDELIQSLKYDDIFSFPDSKWKNLSNNSDLRGLFEIKAFKLRIMVKVISKDIIYVEIVRLKKDDNSRIDRMEPYYRKKALESDYEYIYKRIKSNDNLEKLWQYNSNILEEIYETMDIIRKEKTNE